MSSHATDTGPTTLHSGWVPHSPRQPRNKWSTQCSHQFWSLAKKTRGFKFRSNVTIVVYPQIHFFVALCVTPLQTFHTFSLLLKAFLKNNIFPTIFTTSLHPMFQRYLHPPCQWLPSTAPSANGCDLQSPVEPTKQKTEMKTNWAMKKTPGCLGYTPVYVKCIHSGIQYFSK